MLSVSTIIAQQSQRVDLGDATSAITTTVNALNTLYQDLSKQGEVDVDINQKIRSISTMAFPCREAVINASHNIRSMNEDKKASVVATAKDIEDSITTIDSTGSKETILSTLVKAEKKIAQLQRILGIKVKKKK